MEPKISDGRLLACRSEAVLNVRDGLAIPEYVAGLLRHLRKDSMEGVIDREDPHGVVFGNGQNDEAVIQPDVIPLQPRYFPLRMPVVRATMTISRRGCGGGGQHANSLWISSKAKNRRHPPPKGNLKRSRGR